MRGGTKRISHLAVASIDQLDSLPCQMNSALFALREGHFRLPGGCGYR